MIKYNLANDANEATLRSLLRDNPMPSWVDISMTREPYFFSNMNTVTKDYAVLARDGENAVGMYTCTLQTVFLNGMPCTLGYLGGLRVSEAYRNKIRVIKNGFKSLIRLIPTCDHPYWFTSVASDNKQARKLLERGLKGMPKYSKIGELTTFALPVAQGKGLKLWRTASETDITNIIEFYNRHASGLQLAPQLDERWIRQIGIANFLIYGSTQIEACLAIWNQTQYKQVVINAYQPIIKMLRPLYNIYARCRNQIQLPAPGQQLNQSFLSFAAFSPSVMSDMERLLKDALSHCQTPIAIMSLYSQHPSIPVLKALKPIIYQTCLYTVSFGSPPILDDRPVQPEAALL